MPNSATPIGTYKDIDVRNKIKHDILGYKLTFVDGNDLIVQAALALHRSAIIGISLAPSIAYVLTVTAGGVSIPYNYLANQAPFFRQGKPLWITAENEDLIFNVVAAGTIEMQVQVVQFLTNNAIPSFGS